MADNVPVIDLEGYERLRDVERSLAWRPLMLATSLAAWAGLLLTAAGAVVFFKSFATAVQGDDGPRVTLLLAGIGLSVLGVGLNRLLGWRLLNRLRCPRCGGPMERRLADFPPAERGPGQFRGVRLDGRLYRAPYVDEGGPEPWARLVKEVRVCPRCRVYVDSGDWREVACSAEELERLLLS